MSLQTEINHLVWKEAYNLKQNPKANGATILINLEESSVQGGKMGTDHPFSWYHPYTNGRSWYTNGGPNSADYADARFRAHILGGIQYAAGISVPPSVPPEVMLHTLVTTVYTKIYLFVSDVCAFAVRVVRHFW
jgi:type 1 glutamine amidotransferase